MDVPTDRREESRAHFSVNPKGNIGPAMVTVSVMKASRINEPVCMLTRHRIGICVNHEAEIARQHSREMTFLLFRLISSPMLDLAYINSFIVDDYPIRSILRCKRHIDPQLYSSLFTCNFTQQTKIKIMHFRVQVTILIILRETYQVLKLHVSRKCRLRVRH